MTHRPSPLLPGLKTRLDALLEQEDPMDAIFDAEQEDARQRAAAAFRAAGPELLDEATPHLWAYYRATVDELGPDRLSDAGVPVLDEDADIWAEVTIAEPPSIEVGGTDLEPAAAYVSFEGEVSWEPEHGLQLVVENGERICKVGPYDGHVTVAHAYGDPGLLGTVFKG